MLRHTGSTGSTGPLSTLFGLLLVTAGPVSGQATGGSGWETAGWHLLRPGEDLASIARHYLGEEAEGDQLAARNPQFEALQPGDRVQVQLSAGLPARSALLSVTGGRIEEQPTPISWLRGRRFDLLSEGDGLRTFPAASAELLFADTTRLVITEDSLVFLHDGEARAAAPHPGEIEIVAGQADLKHGIVKRRDAEAIEIVLGEARARPKSNAEGEVEARARRTRDGGSQVMVYRGTSELEAAGNRVQVRAGTGSVIPPGGAPSPPEALLPAPSMLESPPADAAQELRFRWSPVEGAATYTFELCRDADCGSLVDRRVGLRETAYTVRQGVDALAGETYFWRVTAVAASRLDGFPSPSAELAVAGAADGSARPAVARASIFGSVRSESGAAPLPGALVRVVELATEVRSGRDGSFELDGLPPGTYTLEARMDGVVVGRLGDVAIAADRPAQVVILSDPGLIARDEIVVRPSRVSLLARDPAAPLALSHEDILSLPHLGDDLFRALPVLPGTAANDVSAQFHVRGGRRDEVLILLDGQELYDAFHLKDFDNAQSIVPAAALGSVDLTTGGWEAGRGDRMGAVLDMRTATPVAGRSRRVGMSLLNVHAGAGGLLGDERSGEDRGSWLAMARRGSLDLAGRVLGREDPSFWDALGKAELRLGTRHTLAAHALVADDRLDFLEEADGEVDRLHTEHRSAYFWLTHQALLGTSMFVDSFASWSRIDGTREALTLEEEQNWDIRDARSFDVAELRQEWNLQAGETHLFAWGLGLRRYTPTYDYFGLRRYDTVVATVRTAEDGLFRYRDRFSGEHTTAHASDRIRVSRRLMLELGLRYDRSSWLDDAELTPRLNVAYSLGEGSVLRAAWGQFAQSQRPYELQVQDADVRFFPIERSEHGLLGFEHVFAAGSGQPGLALRVEAYRRDIANPRPRYENLWEPYNNFPELEPDRVIFAPERSRSQGVELFLRGPAQSRIGWWVNYSLSSIEDRIDGRWVPRLIDQTHALNWNLDLPLGRRWNLNLAWRFHTGWPTTPLELVEVAGDPDAALEEDEELVDEEGTQGTELGVLLGPVNSRRLSSYHRLDLRASRELPVRKGRMLLFIDVQNVYDRQNLAGFDMLVDDEEGTLTQVDERWPGIFPSLGVSWEF